MQSHKRICTGAVMKTECQCDKFDAISLLCWCSTQVGLFFIAGQDLGDWRWWQSFYPDGRSLMHLSTLFWKFLLECAFHLQLRLPHSSMLFFFTALPENCNLGVGSKCGFLLLSQPNCCHEQWVNLFLCSFTPELMPLFLLIISLPQIETNKLRRCFRALELLVIVPGS